MFDFLNPLRELNLLGITVRLVLAVLCGGLVGLERVYKRRPAGFRTHILVAIGACLTTATSQFLVLKMGQFTDMARLGAQVIAGVGFLGAGSIIVTRRKQVKGLTTAAGLWVIGIVGLACGLGYYEAAVYVTALLLCAELVFARLEHYIVSNTRLVNLFVEYKDANDLGAIVEKVKTFNCTVIDLEVTKSGDHHNPCVILSLQLKKREVHYQLLSGLSEMSEIVAVEEL